MWVRVCLHILTKEAVDECLHMRMREEVDDSLFTYADEGRCC